LDKKNKRGQKSTTQNDIIYQQQQVKNDEETLFR
jgi:hypothetical protein